MFDNLSNRLQNIFSKIRSSGVLTEKNIEEALREVRLAMLEADVNFKVVKNFIENIKQKAIGKEVLESLTPGQQIIKIVNDELTVLLGKTSSTLEMSPKPPTKIMMCGLQGSGKTTSTSKLALYLRRKGQRPLMVAADIYRPAAIDQLLTLGKELNIPTYADKDAKPLKICQDAYNEALSKGYDVIIFDTAGRLHIDEDMMQELISIKSEIKPNYILMVVDATVGQDAVKQAEAFKERLNFDGLIMTKLDGDARGGAALSINAVTGAPIKFVSMGEKADSLEVFHPNRMASRILGMGDMLTLIEKAQTDLDLKKAREIEERLKKNQFTLDDLYEQMQQVKKMGSLEQIMGMIPGMKKMADSREIAMGEEQLKKMQVIIQSMTIVEKTNPQIINGSRRKRIADGSGTSTRDVNMLLKQYEQTKKMMSMFSKKKGKFKFGNQLPF